MLAYGAATVLPVAAADAPLQRAIPSSGERLPAVGLGTWLTLLIDPGDTQALSQRRAVLERFFAGGGARDRLVADVCASRTRAR